MRRLRQRLTPAMVLACLALFVALGGTSIAAVTALPRNSVGTAQVKNYSLLKVDFKRGQLPAGPAGPAGPGARWALVSPNGSIVVQSGGITASAKPGPGQYILDFGSSVAGKLIIVSSGRASDAEFRGTVSAGPCGGTVEGSVCAVGNDANHVQVITNNAGETAREDHAFYVAVIG
jgi:hypothetical protein